MERVKDDYKADAKFLHRIDVENINLGKFDLESSFITLGVIFALVVAVILILVAKGFPVILERISDHIASIGGIAGVLVIVLIASPFVVFDLKRRRRVHKKEDTARKQVVGEMTHPYVKIYEEGIQLEDKFFYWDEVKVVLAKGIIRAKHMKDVSVVSRLPGNHFECYYFIGVKTEEDQHAVKMYTPMFSQTQNPVVNIARILKKMGRDKILQDQGIEWIKGDIDEGKVKEQLSDPFQEHEES